VWLGESADDSDAAMDFLNEIHQKDFASPDFSLDEGIWTALKRLRKRKWWSRMWIIQEALFAKSLKFYCGEKSTDRKAFARLHEFERQLDNGRGHGDRLAPMQMTLAAPFGVILDDWDQYREDIANGGIRLRRLLSVTEDAQCTEPLDNIFALLSMCTELDREVLQIDYRVSMRWAMINLCKYELIAREITTPSGCCRPVAPTKIQCSRHGYQITLATMTTAASVSLPMRARPSIEQLRKIPTGSL
jgi:hypothetical protein